jgi:hypothetical protein
VLFLDVRDQRIIFAADSEVGQWREIVHSSSGKMVRLTMTWAVLSRSGLSPK